MRWDKGSATEWQGWLVMASADQGRVFIVPAVCIYISSRVISLIAYCYSIWVKSLCLGLQGRLCGRSNWRSEFGFGQALLGPMNSSMTPY